MKFTKTGNEYIATTETGTYFVRKSPVFTSQWEATVKSPRENSPHVHAATTFDTMRDAKAWCIEDYAIQN